MKITKDDITSSLKTLGFTLEETKSGSFLSKIKGNNGELVTTVIAIEEDGESVQFMSIIPVKINPVKISAALELVNLVHGKSLWNFRYWLDPEDTEIITFGSYNAIGGAFSEKDFNHIFMCCNFAADRIYPCLMALNYGDKSPKEAFELFYFNKKAA